MLSLLQFLALGFQLIWTQAQSSGLEVDENERAARLAQEADRLYAQLQARWNSEAGISNDPSRQTLHALTSAPDASMWGGTTGSGASGFSATLHTLAASLQQPQLLSSQQQPQLQPLPSGNVQLQSAVNSFPVQGGGLISQTPSLLPSGSLGGFQGAPLPSVFGRGSSVPAQSQALPSSLGGSQFPPIILPTVPAHSLSFAPTHKPTPGMPVSTLPPDEMSRVKANYLKNFPQVSSATQLIAIRDFISQLQNQDFKRTALHFAAGALYESNGVTHSIDLSEPGVWVQLATKMRSGCRFVSKTPAVVWGSCSVTTNGKTNPESLEVTFNPAGLITKLARLEPRSCSAAPKPQTITAPFAAPVLKPRT